MKIIEGVYLHHIKTQKFKTNHLTFRFSGDLSEVSRSRRSLVAQMLATANQRYPNSRLFRQKLSELYGAHVSTQINTRGLVHMVDIDISFISNQYALSGENILGEILDFLEAMLFEPLVSIEQFQSKIFQVEQTNLINYLEADKEDIYYASDLELNQLYFDEPYLQESKYGSSEQIAKENSYTAFQEFRRMLKEDRLDLFLVGDMDDYKVVQRLHHWPLTARQLDLTYLSEQESSNVIRKKLTQKSYSQSVLELAYQTPVLYGSDDYASLLVLNGMLGVFPHSLLFTELREKNGLAYTISSQLQPYLGLLKVQAGIASENRQKSLAIITQQFKKIKSGRFSGQLLSKTKRMLINSAKLASDHPKSLVELTYNQSVFDSSEVTLTDIDEKIDGVTKSDIMTIGKRLTLRALYFLEGVD